MRGRAFLQVARRLVLRSTEEDWRTAAGCAYYSLFTEARAALKSWGFVPAGREPIHSFVRLRFSNANEVDLKSIGQALDVLGRLRNQADYDVELPGRFATSSAAMMSAQQAENAVATLDHIEADANRRAAAIAAIRAARS